MAAIFLENLGKIYPNGVPALVDLSLAISDGERLVLVGPSGCGKTTTLRLIAGLEEPTSGNIFLGGKSMQGMPPWKRQVAMVFQKPALLPRQTVRQNLNFANHLRRGILGRLPFFRHERPEENLAIEHMASLLGLQEVLDRKPAELSGGQVQRVALGRALLRRAPIQLLDEPLGHLEGPLRGQLRRELRLLQRQFPATMVYVTHDPEEALALGERIAVLHRGVLQQVDSPENVLNRPRHRFVAEFFQTRWGPLNFLAGRIVQESDSLILDSPEGKLPLPIGRRELWGKNVGRTVFLGVRPEDIYIQWNSLPNKDWQMQVLLVETCDQGALVTLVGNEQRVTAFLDRHLTRDLAVGSRVQVGSKLDRAFLFDGVTGLNLESTG